MMRVLPLAAAMAIAVPLSSAEAQTTPDAAIFAGGCFWCVESDFDRVPGVLSTTSGYIGGHLANPTYQDVITETSGHREAVRIEFDPSKVSYEQLLRVFFRSVDPTDAEGQFCDRGESYTTAVFATDAQKPAAESAKADAAAVLKQEIATLILPATTFTPAEDFHQNYYRTNPVRYRYYRYACGRDARIEEVWGAAAHEGIPAH